MTKASEIIKQVWIHETETSDGWKQDIVHCESDHLERMEWSDGFEHYVEYSVFEKLLEENKKLRKASKKLIKALKYYSETGRHFGSNDGGNMADKAIDEYRVTVDNKDVK